MTSPYLNRPIRTPQQVAADRIHVGDRVEHMNGNREGVVTERFLRDGLPMARVDWDDGHSEAIPVGYLDKLL